MLLKIKFIKMFYRGKYNIKREGIIYTFLYSYLSLEHTHAHTQIDTHRHTHGRKHIKM